MAENPRETTFVVDGAAGGRVRRLFYSFPQRFEKAYQLEVDHFVRCMEGTDQLENHLSKQASKQYNQAVKPLCVNNEL